MSDLPRFQIKSTLWILRYSKNALFIILLSGCLTPTEIKTTRGGGVLVVSGRVSNLPDQSLLSVGLTAESERLPFPVSGAIVNLYEEDQLMGVYTEDTIIPGNYMLHDFVGIPGKVYHVKITLEDNRMYESAPEKMPDDSGTVSAYFQVAREEFVDFEGILVNQPVVRVFGNSILPPSENQFMKWQVDEVFMIFGGPLPCFVTQAADPQFLVLLDRKNLVGTEYPGQFLARRVVDYSFMSKHYFVTYQSTITKDAFDYWRKVQIVASQDGSMFDIPPATITGNLRSINDPSEKVLGYFEATHQTLHRFFLTTYDFPFTMNYTDCTGNGSGIPPPRCLNCLVVKNSSLVRPPWF
jgi:Domain of unknown function (DUF4249)